MSAEQEARSTTGTPASASDSTKSDLEKPVIAQAPVSETDHHLTGSKLYFVLTGIGLAIFLFALDVSIISTV
jgi:hypothetical protein